MTQTSDTNNYQNNNEDATENQHLRKEKKDNTSNGSMFEGKLTEEQQSAYQSKLNSKQKKDNSSEKKTQTEKNESEEDDRYKDPPKKDKGERKYSKIKYGFGIKLLKSAIRQILKNILISFNIFSDKDIKSELLTTGLGSSSAYSKLLLLKQKKTKDKQKEAFLALTIMLAQSETTNNPSLLTTSSNKQFNQQILINAQTINSSKDITQEIFKKGVHNSLSLPQQYNKIGPASKQGEMHKHSQSSKEQTNVQTNEKKQTNYVFPRYNQIPEFRVEMSMNILKTTINAISVITRTAFNTIGTIENKIASTLFGPEKVYNTRVPINPNTVSYKSQNKEEIPSSKIDQITAKQLSNQTIDISSR